jgi:hypothetical protein
MKIKRIIIITSLAFAFSSSVFSQVGIGTNTPDASAKLDIKANPPAVGLLLPRLTTAERDASIKSPSPGLVIYNSTTNTLEVAISGSLWVDVVNGTTTAAATGTSLSTGQVGIGTTTPNANAVLDVTSTTKGVLLPQSATDPTGVAGMIYYNTASNTVKLFNGTSWIVLTN